MIELERPEWQHHAPCAGTDTEAWFPERGDRVPADLLALCTGCPVRAECVAQGVREKFGVWGGISGRTRRELRRYGHTVARDGQHIYYDRTAGVVTIGERQAAA